MIRNQQTRTVLTLCLTAIFLGGCRLPEVQLATKEPIKIDIDVRLDLYQYSGDKPEKAEEELNYEETLDRQRDRMEQVQTLKDNRFVGENHRGLLTIREMPGGEWGDHVKKTAEEENADRVLIMRHSAREENAMLNEIERKQWQDRVSRSYPGEWVEVEGDTAGTYSWDQVKGEKKEDPLP